MATPPRLVELKCPHCEGLHWEIDHDYRGASLVGRPELSYDERPYQCRRCQQAGTGYRVLRKSPPAFFLQPHPLHPMSVAEFAEWLAVFREAFPGDERLRSVGVFWYPGADETQTQRLRSACVVGLVGRYRLSLSNLHTDDERARVCAQGKGEAHFWCGEVVALDHCYFGFDDTELQAIGELIAENREDIHRAWRRFSVAAGRYRARWLSVLNAS